MYANNELNTLNWTVTFSVVITKFSNTLVDMKDHDLDVSRNAHLGLRTNNNAIISLLSSINRPCVVLEIVNTIQWFLEVYTYTFRL